jgi:hypothetical protein
LRAWQKVGWNEKPTAAGEKSAAITRGTTGSQKGPHPQEPRPNGLAESSTESYRRRPPLSAKKQGFSPISAADHNPIAGHE